MTHHRRTPKSTASTISVFAGAVAAAASIGAIYLSAQAARQSLQWRDASANKADIRKALTFGLKLYVTDPATGGGDTAGAGAGRSVVSVARVTRASLTGAVTSAARQAMGAVN